MSAVNTDLSTGRKRADGVHAPLLQLECVLFKVETMKEPCKDITLHRRGMCVHVAQASFYLLLRRKPLLAHQSWQSQPGPVPAPELCSHFGSARFSLPSLFAVLAVVFVTILAISFSHSQGRGSNVIHCRKDGTWSGSFHLCREMQGQCALPTQLNSHLKLQCSGGYGIGL